MKRKSLTTSKPETGSERKQRGRVDRTVMFPVAPAAIELPTHYAEWLEQTQGQASKVSSRDRNIGLNLDPSVSPITNNRKIRNIAHAKTDSRTNCQGTGNC